MHKSFSLSLFMGSLVEIENSIVKLTLEELKAFREWFWKFEKEQWDLKLEKDINRGALDSISEKAIDDMKK